MLYENSDHREKVKIVFSSSFLQSNVDERVLLKKCFDKIASYSVGQEFFNRLNVLFRAYSILKDQDLRLLVTFSSRESCFDGKISSIMDNDVVQSQHCFDFCGKKIKEEEISNCSFVNVNLNLINNTLYHEELGLCTIVQSISEVVDHKGKLLCSVVDCADPYWMLIVHETIHVEHFILQKVVDLCSYQVIQKRPIQLTESFVSDSKKISSRV